MARIAGVDLPKNKKIAFALPYLFGIGRTLSKKIVAESGVDPNKRTDDLTEDEIRRIREIIDAKFKVEGDVRREIAMNIKRLIDLGAYRGARHKKGLPVRGQRTHTNARTRKGPRKAIIRRAAAPSPA
ncbi:MAG: 30S ribosomal protein S13 [Deltaproteobacteria bacterium]|nr:30S ribosomal protein S13 [Deltaproteobacteria bacterium]